MPIAFTCACGKQLRVREDLAGKRVKCPGCRALLTAPGPAAGPAPPPAPEAPDRPSPHSGLPPGADRLGPLVRDFEAQDYGEGLGRFQLQAAGFLVLGLGMIVLGAVVFNPGRQGFGNNFKSLGVVLLGVLIALPSGALAAAGLWSRLSARRWRGARLWVFRDGLAFARGKLSVVCAWDQVARARCQSSDAFLLEVFHKSCVIHLRLKDGRRLVLDDRMSSRDVWRGFLSDKLKGLRR
jgi:hypothetical protein